jgi:hypothetical protein
MVGITTSVKQTLTWRPLQKRADLLPAATPQPDWKPPEKMQDFIAVEHSISSYKRLYCSPSCAVEDIGEDKHKPPLANLVVPAGVNDVAAVAHNAREAAKLKTAAS